MEGKRKGGGVQDLRSRHNHERGLALSQSLDTGEKTKTKTKILVNPSFNQFFEFNNISVSRHLSTFLCFFFLKLYQNTVTNIL